jgi:hypothetical protein
MKYPYIRAWGKYLGSYQYYINAQVERADKDRAPNNAIYYNEDKKCWATADEITDDGARERIEIMSNTYK